MKTVGELREFLNQFSDLPDDALLNIEVRDYFTNNFNTATFHSSGHRVWREEPNVEYKGELRLTCSIDSKVFHHSDGSDPDVKQPIISYRKSKY